MFELGIYNVDPKVDHNVKFGGVLVTILPKFIVCAAIYN